MLQRTELLVGRLILIACLSGVVVGHVPEVEVPIYFLVDLGGLLEIAHFEEIACLAFEPLNVSQFASDGQLIEVARIFDREQRDSKLDSVSLLELRVLIEPLRCEILVKTLDAGSGHFGMRVLLK